MVIRELLNNTIARLQECGIENAIFEAHQLIRYVLKMSATDLVIHHRSVAEKTHIDAVSALISRRCGGEPLQYILGTQGFMSLEFFVTPDVLIPRSDTEALVEHVLNDVGDLGYTLLDIGTGTGCIPLSIAHYNRRAYTRGIDISEKAIKIAEKNRDFLGLSDRAVFEVLDIMTQVPCGKYDIITSNPPYIESHVIEALDDTVKCYEPRLALDGGSDGLDFYRRIADISPKILNKGGRLVFEIGYNQGKAVPAILKRKFRDIKVIKDLCGNDRVVTAQLKD